MRQPAVASAACLPSGSSCVAIRAYREEDYVAALALWEEASLRPYTEVELARLLAAGGGALVAVLAAAQDADTTTETVIGVVLWSHNGSMGMLWRLAVAEAQRGQRVATRLLDRVEQDIRAAGLDGVSLLTRVSNTVAKSMYARRGYKWNEPLEFWGKKLPAITDLADAALSRPDEQTEEQTSC